MTDREITLRNVAAWNEEQAEKAHDQKDYVLYQRLSKQAADLWTLADEEAKVN